MQIQPIDDLSLTLKKRAKLFIDPSWLYPLLYAKCDNIAPTPRKVKCSMALSQLYWSISIINNINDYKKFSESDTILFFSALFIYFDAIEILLEKKAPQKKNCCRYFKHTIAEFPKPEIISAHDDYKFTRFLRSIIVAHSLDTDKKNPFIVSGKKYKEWHVRSYGASGQGFSPTDVTATNEKCVFIDVVFCTRKKCEYLSIHIYMDELKDFILAQLKNKDRIIKKVKKRMEWN